MPGQEGCQRENRVWQVAAVDFEQVAKDDRSDGSGQNGLQDRPGDAQRGLLVAHLDVPPGEEVNQLAVVPEFLQVDAQPAFGVLDADDLAGRKYLTVCHVPFHWRTIRSSGAARLQNWSWLQSQSVL